MDVTGPLYLTLIDNSQFFGAEKFLIARYKNVNIGGMANKNGKYVESF
jgi:hypothetical protein